MLSVRLPEPLENQLAAYCDALRVTKTSVVQQALELHLKTRPAKTQRKAKQDPFFAKLGRGNHKYTTDQIMRMPRGHHWHQS